MSINEIATAILKSEFTRKTIIIGIEGFGGSGKTTLSDTLKTKLGNAYVVRLDDFIVKEKINENSWDKGIFDRKRLEKQVLIPATSNKAIKYQKLIWQTNKLGLFNEIPKVDYLIIEGISCYHPDIAKYYDYKIWVNTPIEIAKERGRERDGSNENAFMWDLWAENDINYQNKYHPELVADFIFDNSAKIYLK
ncbi:AAA family ATPase [Candidatus Saccharibacteria bacterium]|nr:AAA family ATPase [Candidatus Saccharibacteria bacterium]